MANSSGLSSGNESQRIADAARSPDWSLGLNQHGDVMATHDSGEIGLPWVVLASRAGRGRRVSLYRPGDDCTVEGDVIGEITGNPREMGRQLRSILEEIVIDDIE